MMIGPPPSPILLVAFFFSTLEQGIRAFPILGVFNSFGELHSNLSLLFQRDEVLPCSFAASFVAVMKGSTARAFRPRSPPFPSF